MSGPYRLDFVYPDHAVRPTWVVATFNNEEELGFVYQKNADEGEPPQDTAPFIAHVTSPSNGQPVIGTFADLLSATDAIYAVSNRIAWS